MISAERVREVLRYSPTTGEFTWAVRVRKSVHVGDIAGYMMRGYWRIQIDGYRYQAHRLAWLYVHGVHPPHQVDHKNGNGLDNRLENLRLATMTQNRWNQGRSVKNSSGFKGVYSRPTQKGGVSWVAKIRANGRSKHLGTFADPASAHEAYRRAATVLHGEYARFA